MNESDKQSVIGSELHLPEDKLKLYVDRAQAQVDKLVENGKPHQKVHLFAGPEGGPVTETVLGRIAEAMHVPDLRTLDMQPGPADDREVEGVFESEMGNGVILRLSRVREEDGGAFLELDAIRK